MTGRADDEDGRGGHDSYATGGRRSRGKFWPSARHVFLRGGSSMEHNMVCRISTIFVRSTVDAAAMYLIERIN